MRPARVQAEHGALRGAIVARADARADFLGDLGQDIVDFRFPFGRRRSEQPLVHDRGRSCQQFAKQRRRNIGPQSDCFGQHAVLSARLTRREKPVVGNAGAAVFGDAARDLAIAAPHQHIGDRLAERPARRDGLQMRLAFGLGEIDQIGFGQARRQLQHRAGDGNIVVIGERAQHLHRRIGDRRQADGEFGARLGLDFLDEQAEDVVEQVDMLVVVGAGAVEKQRGNALQRLGALRRASQC